MPRGNASLSKVHYQGKDEDFVIMVDDIEAVQNWKNDRSIPLAQVVSGFKIFVTHKYVLCALLFKCNILTTYSPLSSRHGAQNAYDGASKATLENEFGTSKEDECMVKILEGGTLQATEVRGLALLKMIATVLTEYRPENVKARRMILWDPVKLTRRVIRAVG